MFLPMTPETEDPGPDMSALSVTANDSSKCRTFDIHLVNGTNG